MDKKDFGTDNKTTYEKGIFVIYTLLKAGLIREIIDDYVNYANIDDVYEFLKKHPDITAEQAEEKLWIFNIDFYHLIYDEIKAKILKYIGKRVKVIIDKSLYGDSLGSYFIGILTSYQKGNYNYDDEITVSNEKGSAAFMIPDIQDIIRLKKDDHICPLLDGDIASEIECCNMCQYIAGDLNKRFIRKKYLKKENYIEICKKCKDHFTMEDLKK